MLALLLFAPFHPVVFSQAPSSFTGTGPDWNWGTAANWSSAVPDAAGASALFNASINTVLTNRTIVLGSTRTLGALSVIGGPNVGASGTLTLGDAGKLLQFNNNASDATLSLSGGISLSVLANLAATGNLAINNNSTVVGSITLAGNTTITGTAFFNNTDPYASITVSGAFSASALTKDGVGRLFLNNAATITGPVDFRDGSLVIGANNALGSGIINLNKPGAALRMNLAGSAATPAVDRTLANSINLATTDLIVGREDQASATVWRTLAINPAVATTTSIGAGTRTISVDPLTIFSIGANQSFSGGTLIKQGGGILELGGANSTFSALNIQLGTVLGNLAGDMTLGSGTSIFGAGTIDAYGGNTVLELASSNPANTLTIGAGAHIALFDQATFRLTNATLALLGGTINLNNSGILDYGTGNIILGSTQILNGPASGFNFGANLAFTDSTGIVSTASHRFNLTNTGTQTLSYSTAYGSALGGNITVSGSIVKSGTGRTIVDSTINTLTLGNTLKLNAGVFDLGSTAGLVANGGVAIGAGSLSFGKSNQITGALAFDTTSAGSVLLNGFSQTLSGVNVSAGALARIKLGGDITISTTLNLGNLNFADTTGILSIAGYLPGANSDRVFVSSAPNTSQVWFYGYNPGATPSGNELLIPMLDATTPDFLTVEWTGAANTLDAANWRNWRTVDTNITHEFALPNAPGATATIGNAAGSLAGKTISGANFSAISGTWTLGKLLMDNYPGSANYTVNVGNLIMDSGVAGVPAVYALNNSSWNTLSGNIFLRSDLSIEGGASSYFGPVITGTHNIIINRSGTAVEVRFNANNANWTGDLIVTSGIIGRSQANAWGNIASAALLAGDINTITFKGGGIRGQPNNIKISVPNRILIEGNFQAASTAFTWNGDVLLNAGSQSMYTINVHENTVSPAGVRAGLTFSASTNLVGDAGLVFAGSYTKEILSGSNTFSGGLGVAGSILYTTVGSGGLRIGAFEAGNNYLGTGTIGVTNGTLHIDTQGYDVRISGTNASSPAIIGISTNQTFFIAGSGTTFFGPDANIKSNSAGGIFKLAGDLVLNGGTFGNNGVTGTQSIDLYFDTTTNATGQSKVTSVANGAVDVAGIRNLSKSGPGQTTLDDNLTFKLSGSLNLLGGVLQLTGSNQIVNNSGTTNVNVILNGGALGIEDTAQTFGALNLLAGGGSLLLGTDGRLTFAGVGTGANWITTALLSIQNTSGMWNTDGTGEYVRFSADPNLSSSALESISFTGYEAGAQIVTDGGYWYLNNATDAMCTIEWTGSSGTLWSNGGNWLNAAAPNGIDISVSIKDIDGGLAEKTIDVNGTHTLSRLNVLSSQPAVTLGGSGTLIFNSDTTAARIYHGGGSVLTIGNAIRLDTDIELATAVSTAIGYLDWRGAVSGDGGIAKTGAGTLLLSANNTYTGGFEWKDSSLIQLYGPTAANTGGNYFGTGTLVIGDGTNKTFTLQAYNQQLVNQPSAGTVPTISTTRTISSDFILRGNLALQRQTSYGTVLPNQSSRPATIIFTGNGVLDDSLAPGATYTLNANAANASWYNTLIFQGDLTGSANIILSGGGYIYFNGDNSALTGNFTKNTSYVYVKNNNALGSGTLTISAITSYSTLTGINGNATVSLSNVLNIIGNEAYGGNLLFSLDSEATGQKSNVTGAQGLAGSGTLIFGANHIIAGTGGFTNGAINSWARSGVIRFLGANEFAGGFSHNNATLQVGRDSERDGGGNLISGALGTGTLTFNSTGAIIGAYAGSDSAPSTGTSIRLSNPININTTLITVTNSGSANTLIFDTGSIALRQGKPDLSINVTTAGQALRIESLLYDRNATTAGGITKTGAGILELTNTGNQITAGIDAQAGTVRYIAGGNDNVLVGTGVIGDTAFGTGTLATRTASGSGTAGAFEVVGTDSGTVTITNSDRLILDNNGRFIVSGNDVTTVLATGGTLVSTGAIGQEGSLVAALVRTTDYTLAAKLAAQNWELGAGTVDLARANLLNTTGTITMMADSILDINGYTQTIADLLVTGNASIDVAGGIPSAPIILTFGNIHVDAGSLLTFLNWNGDTNTGLGGSGGANSTIIKTSLAVGRIIDNVTLDGIAHAVRVWRNNNGDRVLLPYDANFTWSGSNSDNIWGANNWFTSVSPLTHSDIKQPHGTGDSAIFDTVHALLAGGNTEIEVTSETILGRLMITGAGSGTLSFVNRSGGKFKMQFTDAIVEGETSTIANSSGLDVFFNLPVDLGFNGSLGENLVILQDSSGHTIFNGPISGPVSSVSVEGTGAGAAIFNAANTFSGTFTLISGNVWLGADSASTGGGPLGNGRLAFQSGTLRAVAPGATLAAYADANRSLSNAYTLDGGFSLVGTGALTLAGPGSLASSSTLAVDSGSLALGGVLSGSGNLVKDGAGTLLLAAANTYTGTTTLAGGTVALASNNSLGTSRVVVENDAALRVDASTLANNISIDPDTLLTLAHGATAVTLSGTLSGSGNLAKTGAATLTLTGENTHTGTLTVTAGTLNVGGGGATGGIASDVVLSTAATELRFDRSTNSAYTRAISGAGSLVKAGAGTLTLTGSNTHTGSTVIQAGTLQIGDGGTDGSILAITDTTRSVAIGANAALAINRADTVVFGGTITGSGTLVQNGSGLVELAAENDYAGGTVINSGTLLVSATGRAGATGATVDVTNAGAFVIGAGAWGASAYDLDYALRGQAGGRAIIDIGSTGTFGFGQNASAAGQNGAHFLGELVMRNAAYRIDQAFENFFDGGGSFRTEAGSVGKVSLASSGSWTMPGSLTFAGGRVEWDFDSDNKTSILKTAGSITIASSATTTFRLNLTGTLRAPGANDLAGLSLFAQDTGGSTLKLAESAHSVGGDYNNTALEVYSGGVLMSSTAVIQTINTGAANVAQGTYDWTAYGSALAQAGSNELKAGYKLKTLEVYKDRTLDIKRTGADSRDFSVQIDDMASGTGAQAPLLNGMGSVRFLDESNARDGILLGAASSYTGTTFIQSGTVTAGADTVLGSTINLIVSSTGAFDLNGHAQTVGAVNTSTGARIDIGSGTLAISDTQRAAGETSGGLIANNTLFGAGWFIIDPSAVLIDGTQAFSGTYSVVGSSTIVLNTAAALDSADAVQLAGADDTVVFGSHTSFGGAATATPSGTSAATFTGSGVIALIDSATVTITGNNTGLEAGSRFDIAAGSQLTAGSAQNLGSADIVDNGRLVIDTPSSWALPGALSGTGALIKLGSGTTAINGANTGFTGTTTIGAGALKLADSAAAGSGGIINNAGLDLNFTGVFANSVLGSGTTTIYGGAVTMPGYNANDVRVLATGALAGTGTIDGSLLLLGGKLQPGVNTWGALTILGNLVINDGAILELDLHTPHPALGVSGSNDIVSVGGTTFLNSGTVNVLTGNLAGFGPGIYHLIVTGTQVGTGLVAGQVYDSGAGTWNTLDTMRVVATGTLVNLLYTKGLDFAYWDGSGPHDDGTLQGGSGIWQGASGTMTWTDTTAPQFEANSRWKDGAMAIFGYESVINNNAGNPGTITVDATTAGEVIVGAMQFMADGYTITGDRITTGGTGARMDLNVNSATVSATIGNTITGTHGLAKSGAGTLVLTGSSNYEGSTVIANGTLIMANEHAISVNTATISAGATLRVATGSMTFSNTVGGEGLFHVNLANSTDSFVLTPASLASFTGTARFNNSAFALNNNALANAGVVLGAGNTTTVATGTQEIGAVTIDGATLAFAYATGTQAAGIIKTDTLDAISGTVSVASNNPATGTTGLLGKPLLQQDEGHRIQLIEASNVDTANLALAGGATTTTDIRNATVTTATATYAQSLDYTNGLAVSYELTQLALVTGQTTILASDTNNPSGGDELHARITGAGSLRIDAASGITINGGSPLGANNYTGTTTVGSGTLILGTDAALGSTNRIDILSGATLDLNGKTQSVGMAGTSILAHEGSTLLVNGGTLNRASTGAWYLDGFTDVTAANSVLNAGGAADASIVVGNTGATAFMHIASNAIVQSRYALITNMTAGASGSVTISGSGFWNNALGLYVGVAQSGTGVLTLLGSGSAQTPTTNIGHYAAASYGIVNIGGNALWENIGTLNIGETGTGVMNLTGGTVRDALAMIGAKATATGSATVSGSGQWETTGALIVGGTGKGTLAIADSGSVRSASVVVGSAATSSGTVRLGGGLLQTGALTAGSGAARIVFDSGTLQAAADNAAFISNFAAGSLEILPGGAFLDSGSHAIGIGDTFTGAGALHKLGTGTLTLSGSSNHAGGSEIDAGAIIMTNTAAIGTGTAKIASGAALRVSTADIIFANGITGSGLLDVALSGSTDTFAFTPASGTVFTGTVQLARGSYDLRPGTANESALSNATLRTQAGSIVNLGTNSVSGSMKINNLELVGGTINVRIKTPIEAHVLEVNELFVTEADAVTFNVDAELANAGAPTSGNFLDQDSGTNSIQLVKAAWLDMQGKQMELLFNGTTPAGTGTTFVVGDAHGNTDIEATYNYAAFSSSSAYIAGSAHSSYIEEAGIYVDYLLTQLKTNTNLVLDSAGAKDTTMSALITGTGNLELIAGAGVITLTHSNSYTGTTTITSGTIIAAATDALGQTAWLDITAAAALNLTDKTQSIGGGQIDGALHGTGSLGLNGLVDITSANAAFAANVGVTGTTTLRNVASLGNTGTVTTAGNAELLLGSASGTFQKTVAGSGVFALENSAVTLGAVNTLSGTWRIDAASTLMATTTANLGTATIAASGTFIMANASDELLANALAGTGAFVKQAAGNLDIATANNAFTGTTLITAGTLTLQNLRGVGSGGITNNAILDLAAAGVFANDISGSGTTHVSGSTVTLGGANQTDWHIIAGAAAQVTGTQNLGSRSTRIDGALAIDSAAAWLYANVLTGAGILKVDTSNNAFNFAATTGTNFAGTVRLGASTFDLSGNNTAALANATLQLDAGNITTVGAGTQHIGNLALNGGRIDFATEIPADIASPAFVSTNTLTIAGGTVAVNRPAPDAATPAAPQLPLLQQDEGLIGTHLASAATVTGNAQNLALIDALTGETLTDATAANINQGNETVATGTYDYGLTSGADNDGLHVTYQLKALDIHDGKTLTLAQDVTDPAKGDDMDALIAGSGNLRIEATGAISLNNTNTYTGTTFITSGTLIAGADNALGQTSLLSSGSHTSYVLLAHTQTIGAIDTAATSALDLSSGALTIQNGGEIHGALAGESTASLTLENGALTITSSNAAFAAATLIDAPATAYLADAAGLGSSDIALAGTLHIANATNGILQNTLAGPGAIVKSAAGTLTMHTSNPGFNGVADIRAGRLTATQIDTLGTAAITVSSSAAFEQQGIAGTLQNPLSGPGTHLVTNSALAIASAPAYQIKNTTLSQGSAITLADDNIRFGTLRMNNGALIFREALAPATARIDTLGDSAGNFVLNADLAAVRQGAATPAGTIADHLDIGDSGPGTHNVFINPLTDLPSAAANIAVELIATGSGNATFVMEKLEYDLTTLELVKGDGTALTPSPGAWYLSDRSLSHAADAILSTASSLALDWASALDALHLRMGEIRQEYPLAPDASSKGNLWLRSRGYRLNAANEISGMSFKQYGWGVTAGADKYFAAENGANILGAFIDIGSVDRQFDNAGSGKTHSIGAGAYITLLKNNGWFADGIARFDRHSNDFEARAVNGRATRGKYAAKSQSLSIEAGKRLQRADGWWLEPGVQMSVLWLNGASYSTQATASQRAIDVRVGDSETWQRRAQLRFGKQIAGGKWRPHGKFAIVTVDSNGGEVTAHNKTFRADYDGKRVEFGLGTTYRIDDISQVYLDYEYAKAAVYERPWSLNLGYRRLW